MRVDKTRDTSCSLFTDTCVTFVTFLIGKVTMKNIAKVSTLSGF